jgi:hypothetical protein
MVSNAQIIEELLVLVDSAPLTKVNFQPILEKYSVGLDFNEQRELRGAFKRCLFDLKKNEDIDYHDPEINISVSYGGVWAGQGGLIKSTLKRKEKLEQIGREKERHKPSYSANFHGDYKGNFHQGDAYHSLQTFNETPKTDVKKEKPKWLTWVFYKEELVKHWFKLLIGSIGVALYSWLGLRTPVGKVSEKQEYKKINIQVDTTKKKAPVYH